MYATVGPSPLGHWHKTNGGRQILSLYGTVNESLPAGLSCSTAMNSYQQCMQPGVTISPVPGAIVVKHSAAARLHRSLAQFKVYTGCLMLFPAKSCYHQQCMQAGTTIGSSHLGHRRKTYSGRQTSSLYGTVYVFMPAGLPRYMDIYTCQSVCHRASPTGLVPRVIVEI